MSGGALASLGLVLITGGTGFLGGAVARHLKAQGAAVRLFARESDRALRMRDEGFEVSTGDIRDSAALGLAADGCAAVIHFAALYRTEGVPLTWFKEVNTEGTRNVVQACIARNVKRLVHVSTVGVYGALKRLPASETHPYGPEDHYQRTKLEGELIVQAAMSGPLQDRAVILRPTGVYGPGDRRFLKLFRAIARRRFVFPGAARALYHPTYIDDLVQGVALALTHPGALNNIYQIAGVHYLPMREYVRTIADALGAPMPRLHVPLLPLKIVAHACEHVFRALRVEPPLYPRRLGFFHFDRAFSVEKARRELGYQPAVDLTAGARLTAESYRQLGWL